MYQVRPERVVIAEWVAEDPRAWERARRLAAAFGCPEAPVVSAEELAVLARERAWREVAGHRTGAARSVPTPDVVLNAFTWEPEVLARRSQAHPELRAWGLNGAGAITFRDPVPSRRIHGCVCQPAHEIHAAYGCLHACDYCHVGTVLNIMTNLEAMAERLVPFMAEHPGLKLYKFDNQTDTICFEPEYGASQVMVEFFARQPGRYLMLYTKSDNVDHLLELEHGGQTIVCWTLSCDTVSRLVEKNAPTTAQRIAAAEKCQRAGYAVRARFSPIVPVRGWREENAAMIGEYLARVRPDVLTMDTFKWLEPRRVGSIVDLELWDPEYRFYVEEYAAMPPESRPAPVFPNGKQLFPHDARARIYRFFLQEIRRHNPRVPVSLCGETPEMWEELQEELGMDPDDYVCACGPFSTPDVLP